MIEIAKPTEQFLREIDIHELLPQQEPFVMIGSLVDIDTVRTITRTEVKADNIFVDNGLFSASGMIENIAQTCAARIGYVNKYILKKDIQLGFIGAIRNLEVLDLPKVGEQIETIVDVQEEVFNMILATAEIKHNDKLLVTAEMKIAVRDKKE